MGISTKQTIRTFRTPMTPSLSKSFSGTVAVSHRTDTRQTSPEKRLTPSEKINPTAVIMMFPIAISTFLLITALAVGILDGTILNTGPVEVTFFPGDLQPSEVVVVMKASVDPVSAGRTFSELVFTRHRVGRKETISRIAYEHGLSASTLISVNGLDKSAPVELKPGTILIVPYRDGFRVSPNRDEGPEELAVRYNTTTDKIQMIPDTGDFFVNGENLQDAPIEIGDGNIFYYPVSGRVVTAYGTGIDTLTGIPFESDGIDLEAESGIPVKASRSGTVIFTGHHASYGLYVMISHSGGWKSFYGHLSRIDVAPGDRLDSADVLGTIGSSGTARSSRLHFALFSEGESVDPLDYLY